MCNWVIRIFAIVYMVALILFVVGTFGLFGSQSGPLAGIFLWPLGLPWNLGLDLTPEPMWPWLAAATPILNIILLRWLCRRFGSG